MNIDVLPTPEALAAAAAEVFIRTGNSAIAAAGKFNVALAGGTTPKRLYSLLGTAPFAHRIDWPRVHVFWGDERCVPPTDETSNYRMAREALLDHVPIPADNIHRIHGEVDPETAAAAYEHTLRNTLTERFDLILLGLGADGHTASLFPGSSAVHEHGRWVAAEYMTAVAMWRVTLTPAVINKASQVVFLVAGADKAAMLQRVIEGARDEDVLPAQIIEPQDGELHWLVDVAAASDMVNV